MTTEFPARPEWYAETALFAKSDPEKARLQLLNTLLPYFLILALMFLSIHLHVPYEVTLVLATPIFYRKIWLTVLLFILVVTP